MKITEHFTLEELTATDTKIINIPNNTQFEALKLLCINVLEPLRQLVKMPIVVNSGFRNSKVNKAVEGETTSQHLKGEAADIKCKNNALLFYLIIKHLDFDQVIWEYGTSRQPNWVHVSFKAANNRKEIVIIK